MTAAKAKVNIDEQATVWGKVTTSRYAARTRGKRTFLNLNTLYANQIFIILIWGGYREKFGAPEEKYEDKRVCVSGKITEYRGALEVVGSDPQDIEMQK